MTSLLGITNFGDVQESTLVKTGFQTFLDWGLVDAGAYVNIKLQNNDVYGQNKSRLRAVNDPSYSNGQVWETFHRNLVWESGVNQTTQPIKISGIYVGNSSVFYPSNTSGTYKHYVDYKNGRVVFNNAIPANSIVKMEYSYKSVYVTDASKTDFLKEIQYNSFQTGGVGYNTPNSGDWSQLGETRIQPLLISLDVVSRKPDPYEIGSNAKIMKTEVIAHIIGQDSEMVDKLESILVFQKGKTFLTMDLNMMAQSGAFPLNYRGELNSNARTYPDLSKESSEGGYRNRKAYIVESYNSNSQMISTSLYYKVVRLEVETIKPAR